MRSSERNVGKVSFTYKDSAGYGAFINRCRVEAWRMAIARFQIPTRRVLDVGCSYGSWFENWKELGFGELVGIDPNQDVIGKARERYDDARCMFAVDLPEHFAGEPCIAANAVVVHILEKAETVEFLRSVASCLDPAGFFAYSVVNAKFYLSAGRKERITELSCVRELETHRVLAEEAGVRIVGEIGTFIDPWAMTDLEFLAGWLERREDPQLYEPFVKLGALLRGASLAPFSEVLLVTQRAH